MCTRKFDPKKKMWNNFASVNKVPKITVDNYQEVIKPWVIDDEAKSGISKKCICGRIIKNYYELINIDNGEVVNLGTSCSKIFQGIDNKSINKDKIKVNFSEGYFINNMDIQCYVLDCIKSYLEKLSLEELLEYREMYKEHTQLIDFIDVLKDKKIKEQTDEMCKEHKHYFKLIKRNFDTNY